MQRAAEILRRSGFALGASLPLPRRGRLALWLLVVAGLALFPFRSSLELGVRTLLSPLDVVEQGMIHRWGVLALGLLWLSFKRQIIWRQMGTETALPWIIGGLGCLAVAPVLFPPAALLGAALGIFAILFGRAVILPFLMFAIYCFAALFPLVVEARFGVPFATSVAYPVTSLIHGLGYPLTTSGLELQLTTIAGDPLRLSVTAACAGPATLGLFLAAFAFMVLDQPLPWPTALALLWFGITGTWIQSLVRLVVLLLTAYYGGGDALGVAHELAGYVLFSGWFVVFAYIYLDRARTLRKLARVSTNRSIDAYVD